MELRVIAITQTVMLGDTETLSELVFELPGGEEFLLPINEAQVSFIADRINQHQSQVYEEENLEKEAPVASKYEEEVDVGEEGIHQVGPGTVQEF